jgi:hypothetical protein
MVHIGANASDQSDRHDVIAHVFFYLEHSPPNLMAG